MFACHRYLLLPVFIMMIVAPVNAQRTPFTGVWHTVGYGFVLAVAPDAFKAYQVTAVSCVALFSVDDYAITGDRILLPDVAYNSDEEILLDHALIADSGVLLFDFGGLIAQPLLGGQAFLPDICENGITESDRPIDVFDVFWQMMHEHYAFFDLYDVDWNTVRDTHRPRVTPDMDDEELFALLAEMVTPLQDGHIDIVGAGLDYSPGLEPAWAADGVDGYLDVVLDEYIIGDYDEAASGLLVYGDLSDAVGYMAILSMEGFADDFDDADDIEVLGDTLPQILSRFADKDVLVIDVRFNDGGEDANALYIAGHFADEPTLAFTKDVQGNTFVEPLELHIEPQTTQPFAGDVVVMTSGYTFSAAEVFTGAMIALPNVTTIGEATGGGFSDTLIALLPNGWHFTLSNEVYTLHDGRVYEGQGLPPDVKAPMRSTPTDRDVDPVLNHVLR